ncbi:MAG: hypothetical protein ABJL67_19050 [Sulfitobacter sp.]
MELIADIFLAAGALGAGFYCFVLGRRLNRFNDLEKGVGGAVAVLSAQVDDLTKTLEAAQTSAKQSAKTLTDLVDRSEDSARKLELQMASLHDLPEATSDVPETPPSTETQPVSAESNPPQQKSPPEVVDGPMFVRRREQTGAH